MQVPPKILELVTDIHQPIFHVNCVYVPAITATSNLTQITTLIMRNPTSWESSDGPPYLIQHAQFSRSAFPNLRTLILDGWKTPYDALVILSPLPKSFALPTLTHVVFVHARLDDMELLPFLPMFQGSLSRVEF